MSAVAQVAVSGAPAPERTTSVLRSPSTRRLRPSITGVADRTALASERALADLATEFARLKAENAALKGDISQLQAQSAEAAVASKAALQAQATTIEAQALTNAALREELAESEAKNATLVDLIKKIKETYRTYPNVGGSCSMESLRIIISLTCDLKE